MNDVTNPAWVVSKRPVISTRGVVPACRSLDCVSIFALSVPDAQTVLSLAQGCDPDDSFSRTDPGASGAIDAFVNLMPWGTPEQVYDKIVNIRTMIGTNAVMPGFSYGGMPYDLAESSLRLFAAEVLPELQRLETEPLAVPGAAASV